MFTSIDARSADAAAKSSSDRFDTLDGLRGLAALAVVLLHRRLVAPTWHIFEHGYLAVDFFFMLSGFVIAYAYLDRFRDKTEIRRFLKQRAIRLFPIIILGVALGGALLAMTNRIDNQFVANVMANAALIPYQNSELVPAHLGIYYFATDPPLHSLFWELVVNVMFAFVAPYLSQKLTLFVAAIGYVALLAAMTVAPLATFGQHPSTILFGLPRVLYAFYAGVALFQFRKKLPCFRLPPIVIALVTMAVFLVPEMFGVWEHLYELLILTVVLPAIMVAGSQSEVTPALKHLAKSSGDLSYPVYATHWPLFGWYDRLHFLSYRASLIVAVAAIIVVNVAILKMYDEPLRRWLRRRLIQRRQISTRASTSREAQ